MSLLPCYTRRAAARQLALELMAQYGLSGWRFEFNWRRRSLGLCRYTTRTLELSVHFVERNSDEEIRDTLLHEIAHALVGPDHGHDAVWRAKCVEIGARPRRCGDAAMPEGRWQATCGSCGAVYRRHRRPPRMKKWYCRVCGPERGNLVWRIDAVSGR